MSTRLQIPRLPPDFDHLWPVWPHLPAGVRGGRAGGHQPQHVVCAEEGAAVEAVEQLGGPADGHHNTGRGRRCVFWSCFSSVVEMKDNLFDSVSSSVQWSQPRWRSGAQLQCHPFSSDVPHHPPAGRSFTPTGQVYSFTFWLKISDHFFPGSRGVSKSLKYEYKYWI